MPSARDLCVWLVLLAACEADGDGDPNAADADTGEDDSTGEASSGSDGDSSGSGGEVVWPSLDERPCPPDSDLTWENFGGPYVLSYCTSCHHTALPADVRQLAPVAVNLESVELVRTHAARVWARAADQNLTMPPVGAPAAEQRALLGEWLACGAPTNADLGVD